MGANSLAFGALIPFVPMLAAEKHWPHAQWFYTLYAVFLIASRFITGKWSDQYGRHTVVLPGMAMVIVTLLLLSWSHSETLFFALAALYGLASGTVQPSLMAMVADRIPKEQQGSGMATFTMLNDLGIAVGSFIMGSLGSEWGYGLALLWISVGITFGWLLLLLKTVPIFQNSTSKGLARESLS